MVEPRRSRPSLDQALKKTGLTEEFGQAGVPNEYYLLLPSALVSDIRNTKAS